jgi:HK97 gp10 family phage protein
MPSTSLYGATHFELGIRDTRALAANFHRADQDAQDEIRVVVARAAEDTVSLAFLLCPKRTQFMADHIKAWFTTSGLGFEVGWDATDFIEAGFAFYPYFVEFGTRFMAAQPTLGPAWRDVAPRFHADLSRALQRAVRRLS